MITELRQQGRRAKAASRALALVSGADKDIALGIAAELLVERGEDILAANADDVARAAPAVLTHRLIPAERHVSPARTHEAAAQALARVVSATAVPGRR